jgi:hypothetical protein
MHAIHWPEGFLPGFTDNYVSNEVIVAGLDPAQVWPWLVTPATWPTYYANSAEPAFLDGSGPQLQQGSRFFFKTFGFPVDARCTEYVAPARGRPGRVAWHGWAGAEGAADRLDVHHAWLVEELEGGRLRILTQETQVGEPAKALAGAHPDPMLNGHQDWLNGLVSAARGASAR